MITKYIITKVKILICLWLFTNIPLYSQWYEQESGTDADLNAVFFLDSLKGWIVGNDSTVLMTTNGGVNWIIMETNFGFDYNDVLFVSDSVGWIVGGFNYEGIILNTTNAGQTWEIKSDENMRGLHSITFVNDTLGFIAGGVYYPGWGIILKTRDGGINWDTSFVYQDPNGHNFYDIDFINTEVGWAVGGVQPGWGNIIIKTTDGGENWITQLEDFFTFPFSGCDFISEKEGWVTTDFVDYYFSDSPAILHTSDGGDNWVLQDMPDTSSSYYLKSIYFKNSETGWCSGDNWSNSTPDIFYTTDSGNTWVEQQIPIQQYTTLNSIYFIIEEIGWAVGSSGVILHTTNGGLTFVEEQEIDDIPTDYYLSNNFPNPFNPSTKIKYSVPQTSQVQIKVFDVLGNEIETLVNEEKPTGSYEITWYAEGLPSGVYFYQIKAGDYIETKKMLLLK